MTIRRARRVVVTAAMAAGIAAASTVAEDAITRANKGPAQGSISIAPTQSFTSVNGVWVDMQPVPVQVINGKFRVDLEPTPAGVFYTAAFQLDGAKPEAQRWFVIDSATPLRLRDVQMGTYLIADAWRGAWSGTVTYGPYDKVSYGGSSWIALAPSKAVTPGTDATKWDLVAAQGATGVGLGTDDGTTITVTPGRNVALGATVLSATGANLTSTDQATPSNPSAGKTAVYTKTGTLCALSPAGSETCTGSGGGGGGAWGGITGTLSAQTDLEAALDGKEASANKGQTNGYAGLDSGGRVPVGQLPALGSNSISCPADNVSQIDCVHNFANTTVLAACKDATGKAAGGATAQVAIYDYYPASGPTDGNVTRIVFYGVVHGANCTVWTAGGIGATGATGATGASGAGFGGRGTYASMTASSPATNDTWQLVDAVAPGACSAGGGTSKAVCVWSGSAWVAPVSSGGGMIPFLGSMTVGAGSTAWMGKFAGAGNTSGGFADGSIGMAAGGTVTALSCSGMSGGWPSGTWTLTAAVCAGAASDSGAYANCTAPLTVASNGAARNVAASATGLGLTFSAGHLLGLRVQLAAGASGSATGYLGCTVAYQ